MRLRIGIVMAIVVMLAGCDWFGVLFGLNVELRFAVPVASRAIAAETIEPTYVGIMSLGDDDRVRKYIPLGSDAIHATVPRDRTYSIMIYGPDLDGRIVPAGAVRIGSFDLDLLPVGTDGESVIDLGVLTGTTDGFVSSVSETEVADALGYSRDTLREFGAYDGQIVEMLNPDVNGDGVIDEEQGIRWGLFVTFEQTLLASAQTLAPDPSLRRSDLMTLGGVSYSFWTTEDQGRYFTQDQLADLAMDLPVAVTLADGGAPTSTIEPYFCGPQEAGSGYGPIVDNGGSAGSGAFAFYGIGDLDPPGPYTGDHVVHIGLQTYRIDSVDFVSDSQHIVGLPFPVYTVDVNPDQTLHRVEWAWYVDDGSGIEPAGPEFVGLMVSAFSVQLGPWITPGPEGWKRDEPSGWESGGVLDSSDFGTIDLTVDYLNFYLRDLRGNTYQHWCSDTYLGPR